MIAMDRTYLKNTMNPRFDLFSPIPQGMTRRLVPVAQLRGITTRSGKRDETLRESADFLHHCVGSSSEY